MKKYLLLIPALAFLITSCDKDDDNGSGGNQTEFTEKQSYLPVSENSWWKYKDSASSAIVTRTATNITKVLNGITLTYMSNNPATPDSSYLGRSGSKYYNYSKGSLNGSNVEANVQIADTSKNIGETWSESNIGSFNGFNASLQGTMLEKNITKVVEGKTYTNVIHTLVKISVAAPFVGNIEIAEYDCFMARGVGAIQLRSTIKNTNTSADGSTRITLTEHEIK